MRRLPILCLFFILATIKFSSVEAQEVTNAWRVLTKTITNQRGEKNVYEYLYSYDNRIKTVKYLGPRGTLYLSIINFNFNRNNKPESYTVLYNDGSKIDVKVKYDIQGRISELEKVFGREVSTFSYRYSSTSIVVTQKSLNSANPLDKANRITFYTEQGDYSETTSDPSSQTITTVIILNKNMDPEINPHPNELMGGFEPPRFLGVLAFGNEPKITASKDENGLITSLSFEARGSNRTFDYTYIKVKNSEPVTTIPVENNPATIISTNINCPAGKEIIERILKSQDGVQSVKVDIRTGKLSLVYSSDGTPYTEIINLINEAGFNGDKIKSTSPEKSPCKESSPVVSVTSISIQTNINCAVGKRKIESLLKEKTGVVSANADIKSGRLEIGYNKTDINMESISRIVNSAGFDADRKKTTNPENNPCKESITEDNVASINLQTNINCAVGKRKVESLLKEQNGVIGAIADIVNGQLIIQYNKANINTEAINRIISGAGFDADRKKSTNPANNPCKEPEPQEQANSITIQTNISCVEGKQKLESILKKQAGVSDAKVDSRTGMLELVFSKKEIVSSQIIRLINQAGFDADKIKSANPENNPCIKKPSENSDKPYTVTLPKEIPKEVSQSKISTIQGKLFYRYKKENEQPVSKPLSLPAVTLPLAGSTSDKISYPDFVAAQRFPKTTDKGTQPLRNAKIMLVYTTLSPRQVTPTRYEDIPFPGFRPSQNDPLYKNYLLATNDPVIATGVTDNNGNFSLTFYNALALGYLGSFSGFEISSDADRKNDGQFAGDFHMYGALRLLIDQVDYYSPEILLFPKPGKITTIPDELGLVKSFDLTVSVKSSRLVLDQAVGTGVPISNYPVNIGRLQSKISGSGQTNPFESRELEIGVKTDKTSNGDTYKIFDQGITNGNGEIIFQNLSLSNDHLIQAIENKFDGSFVYKKQDLHLLTNPAVYGAGNYNSTAVTGKSKAELMLMPQLPELYVTTQAKVNGKTIALEDVDVTLFNYYKAIDGKKEEYVNQNFKTSVGGHLQVKNLPIQTTKEKNESGKMVDRVVGPERSLILNKSGYYTMMMPNTITGTTLQLGQRWPGTIINLKGRAKLSGRIENESGKGVAAEIKVADGPSVKTTRVFDHDGYFFLDNAPTGNKITILITPVVDQYFADTITIDLPEGKATDLGRIKLKEKLHRVVFKVIDENKKPVYDAWVSMNNSTTKYSTGKDGTTSNIEIASPANEFKIKINADGFVSYHDYVIVPISKDPRKITVTLIKGKVVSGYVTDAETKQPVNKARVYTITGYNDDGAIEVETYTNEKGFYELRGISKPGSFIKPGTFTINKSYVNVYAVKSGDPAYIQQVQTAKGDDVTDIKFSLQRMKCNSTIWGLPVEITSAEKKGSGFFISGAFVKLPSNGTFKTLGNEKLAFKNVFVNVKESANDLGGLKTGTSSAKCTLEPVENSITTEVSELKIIVFEKFNCEVRGALNDRNNENLVIRKSKDGACGILSGFVETTLESFNFSYKYTGGFILQPFTEKPGIKDFGTKKEMIDVFGASNCFAEKLKFKLAPDEDDQSFYVHNFKASFRSADSYVVKDTFSLGTNILLDIPLVKNKSLDAGTIKVLPNKIIWNDYAGKVDVEIESWRLKGSGLTYDKNQGGFRVTDAILQTNLPELPLKSMIITPTNLDPGKDNIDPTKDVTLAGVASLTLNNAVPTLVLEQSAPHDQQQHWRLNLYNTTNAPVAYLQNIPGIAADDKIAINLFSNYSDGKKTLSINGVAHTFFKVMQQNIENIEIGKDFFTLIGNTNLQIPGANSNITGRFKYTKVNGKITCTPEKLNTDVELAGNVFFTGGQSIKDYELRDGYFSAIGSAQIYEKSKNDGFALKSKIIKDGSGIRLELMPGQNLPVAGSSSQKMKINYGKAVVNNANSSWENLKFNTSLEGYQVVKKDQNQLDFEVKGAIALDPNGKKLQLDNIETPLGGLELSFDFAKKSFYGQLRFEAPIVIPPGLFTVYKGIAEVQLDGNGFIFTGSFSEVEFNPLSFLEEFQLGLAVGYYSTAIPEKMANNLKMITLQKQIPASLNQGLKGVYVSVSKGFSEGVDIPIIDMKIGISAGIDIRTIVNFNSTSNPDVYVTLYGLAEGHAYVGDELRTGGELKFELNSIVGFKSGKFALLFSPGVAVKAVLLGKGIADIEGTITVGIDGTSFIFKPSF